MIFFLLLVLSTAPGSLFQCMGPAYALSAEVRSGPYTVVHSGSSKKTAKFVIGETEEIMTGLKKEFAGEFTLPVTIFLLDKKEGGDPAPPPWMPTWFAGAALPEKGIIYLKTSSAILMGTANIRQTLEHELTHLYLRFRTGNHFLPRWLEEGLAMKQAGEYSFSHRLSLSAVVVRGDLEPFSRLEYSFPQDGAAARRAYAASFKFVGFLLQNGGKERMKRLLDMVGQEGDFYESFKQVYGRSLVEAERSWRHSMKKRYRWITVAAGGTTIWSLMAVFFILVYWWKRTTSRRKLAAMEEEETAALSDKGFD